MLYKHVNNTDVAIEVIKKFYVKEKEIFKLKVVWWNIGKSHKPWYMGIMQNIVVSRHDWFKNWHPYFDEEKITTHYMSVW